MERLSIPKAAVWVDEADAVGSGSGGGFFYAVGDFFGCLDVVDLDVDHADADADARVDVLQGAQVACRAVGEFEHQVIGAQLVEKVEQGAPLALLDGLASRSCQSRSGRPFGCLRRCCRVRR